jgi:hypothetical protein
VLAHTSKWIQGWSGTIADVDSSCDTSIGTIEAIVKSQSADGLDVCHIFDGIVGFEMTDMETLLIDEGAASLGVILAAEDEVRA